MGILIFGNLKEFTKEDPGDLSEFLKLWKTGNQRLGQGVQGGGNGVAHRGHGGHWQVWAESLQVDVGLYHSSLSRHQETFPYWTSSEIKLWILFFLCGISDVFCYVNPAHTSRQLKNNKIIVVRFPVKTENTAWSIEAINKKNTTIN